MTRTRITLCISILLLTFSQFGNAAQPQVTADDFPVRLLGQWSGEGKTLGMNSRPTMRWERVLANKFVHLYFRNEMKTAQGKVEAFEGHAYYKTTGGGRLTGNWFDSGGSSHPIQAVFADNALTSQWGTEQTEMGATIYRLVSDDSVEIVDSVRRKDGIWREFSRTLLKRS